jgi:SAM-dependent methyltransferase
VGDHIYSDLADRYIKSSAEGPVNALYDRPAIRHLLGSVAGRRVLELGCAAGYLTRDLLDEGAEVIALDKSKEMILHARSLTQGRARVEVADLNHALIGIDDSSIDLAVASLVLHYLPDWTLVLSEVFRTLRPGGAFVMSVHHPITGWFRSDRNDYHRIELIDEVWNVDGVETTAQMWRRPVSAIFTPLLDQGFSIDAVYEPAPAFDGETVSDTHTRTALNSSPVFLYVRALRPTSDVRPRRRLSAVIVGSPPSSPVPQGGRTPWAEYACHQTCVDAPGAAPKGCSPPFRPLGPPWDTDAPAPSSSLVVSQPFRA